MAPTRPLSPGIYAPTLTFFKAGTEDLDFETITRHAQRLARAGLAGFVANGSNGEAVHLGREERKQVTLATRKAIADLGLDLPIIVGASDQSVRGTLALCNDAQEAGGDYVMLLPPSYYKWAVTSSQQLAYFTAIADASPLPIIIYNYPGAAAGIDLDSAMLIKLLQHPNIVGIKFTCGSTGKLARLAYNIKQRGGDNTGKVLFAGMADFIVPALTVGGSGTIAGGANIFPKLCVQVFNHWKEGKTEEARAAQLQLAEADEALSRVAIPGYKAILEHFHGYGGIPRAPMQPFDTGCADALMKEVEPYMKLENSLPDYK